MKYHHFRSSLRVASIFILWAVVCFAASADAGGKASEFDHSHAGWNEVLQAYVVEDVFASKVRYKALKENQSGLKKYLAGISAVSRETFDGWSYPQQLSFLINAYNAFTVKLILDHYPVDSIKDVGTLFSSPWKKEFFQLFGKKAYLDYIEHELIRGRDDFKEPRIHFAVVCASIGCPKLQTTAFTANNVDTLLEAATKDFLSDKSRNRFIAETKTLELSSIFTWYEEDFEKVSGSINKYVSKYLGADSKERKLIAGKQVAIEFLDYDWALNDVQK